MLSKIVLALAALQLLIFGVMAIFQPVQLLGPIGFVLGTGAAIIEARAFYGGAELGLGLALLAAVFKPRWREFALVLSASLFGAIALVRGVSMVAAQISTTFLNFALAVEILTAVLAFVAWRRQEKLP
jgi:hypothetical protein